MVRVGRKSPAGSSCRIFCFYRTFYFVFVVCCIRCSRTVRCGAGLPPACFPCALRSEVSLLGGFTAGPRCRPLVNPYEFLADCSYYVGHSTLFRRGSPVGEPAPVRRWCDRNARSLRTYAAFHSRLYSQSNSHFRGLLAMYSRILARSAGVRTMWS